MTSPGPTLTPLKARQVQKATDAYQLALATLGVQTVAEAIAMWEDVPVSARGGQATAWLNKAIAQVLTRRRLSRELARAYYRLVRALVTGSTVADPRKPEPSVITLGDLRREFSDLIGEIGVPVEAQTASGIQGRTEPISDPENGTQPRQEPLSEDDDADRILVEEINRLQAEEDANEKAAEEELRQQLELLGPANQDKLLSEIDDTKPASEVDKLRSEAHDKAGARQAASAARSAMNGARSQSFLMQELDKKAIGYVRVSTSGTPCGWCAMLISRGPVYKSERTATYSDGAASYEDGDKYHDNCYCIAIPVFSVSQYENDPRFAQNREYQQAWPVVTDGLGGKDAISAFRYYIRQTQAAKTRRSRAS